MNLTYIDSIFGKVIESKSCISRADAGRDVNRDIQGFDLVSDILPFAALW